ncbi:uncharacterized protein V1513DRAFT_419464 [Lipomyces chichibuensis]|uniref:uncharacterized protein n=1 Tax=Lipomyces chichibuensis TaxID=1546026 RepID=UPI0033432ECF
MTTPTRRSTRNIPRKSYRLSPEPNDIDYVEPALEDDSFDVDDIVFEDDDDLEDMELLQEEPFSSPEPKKTPNSSARKVTAEEPTASNSRGRPKKKAKAGDFGISEDELTEIEEVFSTGCDSDGRFPIDNMEDAIIALGFETSQHELRDIIETADPESSGNIEKEIFVEIMAYKYQERKQEMNTGADAINRDEIEHAFHLFIDNRPDRRYITIQDLRNAAILAKDDVTDEDLQEMLRVASGNAYGTVTFENFATVIRKSGAIA